MSTTSTPSITASVQYLAGSPSAVYNASVPGGEVSTHDGKYVEQEVEIHSARGKGFSLNREGFTLVDHDTAVKDYTDAEQMAVHDAEIEAIIKRTTGASRVIVFDNTRRAASDALRKEQQVREPASVVHNDYTRKSAPQRLRDLHPEEAEELLQKRFAIVGAWRTTAGTVETHPMAMCDTSTVVVDDLVDVVRQAKDRVGGIQMVRYNDAHRWYYYPQMQPNEALLLKTYDSAEDGRAQYNCHTAFVDPTSPPDAAPRQSIETRCFVFFDEPREGAGNVAES